MKHITSTIAVLEDGGIEKQIVEIRCDSLDDITPADSSWAVGSIAWVVEDATANTGKFYGLTSSGTWTEQT